MHLLLPTIKTEIKATIHVACTYLKLVYHNVHKIVSEEAYSPCNTKKKNQAHFKNCVKSTRNRELLKPERLAKFNEWVSYSARPVLFYSFSKESTTVLWLQCDLYSLYAWPLVLGLVTRLNLKKIG